MSSAEGEPNLRGDEHSSEGSLSSLVDFARRPGAELTSHFAY